MPSPPSIGFLKLLLLGIVTAYLVLAIFALLFGNRLSFPALPSTYIDSEDIMKFSYAEDRSAVSMVFLKHPESRYLVFYHHGNQEDLQSILPRLEALRSSGFSVLAWDYPGYGTSNGRPSEDLILEISAQIMESVPAALGFSQEQVIQYGRSIGSGPAIALARRLPAAGLILEGAFTSIFRVVTRIRILPWDIFNNIKNIGAVHCPVLFLHGTDDKTVPFHHGRTLYNRAPEPKFFAWFETGRHNDLPTDFSDTYLSSVSRFREFLETRRSGQQE